MKHIDWSVYKYSHFVSNIKYYVVKILPFKIGAHNGHITKENSSTLHTLHSFCTKDIKFKMFKKNISAIAVLSSYYIFNCRNEKDWEGCEYIRPPFPNNWRTICFVFKPAGRFVIFWYEIYINPPMWCATHFYCLQIFCFNQ